MAHCFTSVVKIECNVKRQMFVEQEKILSNESLKVFRTSAKVKTTATGEICRLNKLLSHNWPREQVVEKMAFCYFSIALFLTTRN